MVSRARESAPSALHPPVRLGKDGTGSGRRDWCPVSPLQTLRDPAAVRRITRPPRHGRQGRGRWGDGGGCPGCHTIFRVSGKERDGDKWVR